MKRHPLLVLATLGGVLVLLVGGWLGFRQPLPEAISLDCEGQPTIGYGKAPVHIVVFEEPKCIACAEYTNTIYPKIKKELIDTHKVLYTVIPVSFLPGSMTAAIALYAVYHQDGGYPNSELFFTYLDYIYDHQPPEGSDWATIEEMVLMAQEASPAINVDKLHNNLQAEEGRISIVQNTQYATDVMGGGLATPTIYVNGMQVRELSYAAIKDLVLAAAKGGS